jgi:hypothetical protein
MISDNSNNRLGQRFIFCLVFVMSPFYLEFSSLGTETILYHAESGSDKKNIPDSVASALQSNAEALNPITLVWVKQKKTKLNLDEIAQKVNKFNDYGFLERSLCVFMWQDQKGFFSESCNNAVNIKGSNELQLPHIDDKKIEKKLAVQERSFDGEVHCAGTGHHQTEVNTPTIGVFPESWLRNHPLIYAFPQRYTTWFGYKFPNLCKELGESQCSYILSLTAKGELIKTSDEIIDNKKLFYIAIKSLDVLSQQDRIFRFWLDPDYNYAVVRNEIESVEHQTIYSIKNEQFKLLPNKKIFLPQKTVVTYFADIGIKMISATPIYYEEFLLTEVSTKKINNKQFDLRIKYTNAGTIIGDRILKDTEQGVQYIYPANPADLDRVIESALTGKDFVPTPIQPMWMFVLRLILCVVGTAMALYGGYLKFIKKR